LKVLKLTYKVVFLALALPNAAGALLLMQEVRVRRWAMSKDKAFIIN